jgi:hypothetical protein
MKSNQTSPRQLTRWIALFCLIILSLHSTAQKTPSGIPENGFWQLINSPDQKDITILQCYTFRSELIYEEKLEGVRLNMRRHQTYTRLNQILEKALQNWSEKKTALRDMGWLAQALKS